MVAMQHRREDEVELIGTDDCRLTTSLQTSSYGSETGMGMMFTVEAKESLELRSLEFETYPETENLPVQVYALAGDFSGAASDPTQWTIVADTKALHTPDGNGAIIPANDFGAITMNRGQTYSIYVSCPSSNIFKFKSTSGLIGGTAKSDDNIRVNYGVAFDEGPFPEGQFSQVVDFSGVLHYEMIQSCSNFATTTDVMLEFAINGDPDGSVIRQISDAVEDSMSALLILNPELLKFSKFFYLEVEDVQSGFMGRSKEKCPGLFETCSLIHATVKFSHLQSISSGTLQRVVLSAHEEIGESVTNMVDFEIEYVGDPIVSEDYLITLVGVPNTPMNALQTRYFERVSAAFLNEFSDIPIYSVEVIDQVTQGGRRLLPTLRGSRSLQNTASTGIAATIYGSGNERKLRSSVVEGITINADRYISELALQQHRPGEINQQNAGAYFRGISGIRAGVKPAGFSSAGTNGTSTGDGDEEGESENTLWILLCAGGMVFSFLWIVFKVYWDCLRSPKLDLKVLEHPDYSDSDSYADSHTNRRPSWDGGRRPSMDSPGRPLDVNSMHNRSIPFTRNLPQRSKSDNVRLTPISRSADADGYEKTGYEDSAPSQSNGPTNPWTDDKRRGIRPSRSFQSFRRFFPGKQQNPQQHDNTVNVSGQDSQPVDKSVDKNIDQKVEDGKAEPQRGVRRTRSMPTPTPLSRFLGSKPKQPPQGAVANSASDGEKDSSQQEEGGEKKDEPKRPGGVGKLTKAPPLRQSPKKVSETTTDNKGESQPLKDKKVKPKAGKKNKKKNQQKKKTPADDTTSKPKKAKNQAGKKRGIAKSKSLPTPTDLTSTVPKDLEDWNSSGDESEASEASEAKYGDSGGKDPRKSSVRRRNSVDVQTVGSDSDADSIESAEAPDSAISLFPSQQASADLRPDLQEAKPQDQPKNAAGQYGRGVARSKSLPDQIRQPLDGDATIDGESSEESELDMGFDSESDSSCSSEESEYAPGWDGYVESNNREPPMTVDVKKKATEQGSTESDSSDETTSSEESDSPEADSSSDESESSDESDSSDAGYGKNITNQSPGHPFHMGLPKQPTRYASDDDTISSRETIWSTNSKPFQKLSPKNTSSPKIRKHAPMPAPNEDPRSQPIKKHPPLKKIQPVKKSPNGSNHSTAASPKNKAGTNGRGIGASKSMPKDLSRLASKHYSADSDSDNRSTGTLGSAPRFKKHPPLRSSSNASLKKVPPVKKVSPLNASNHGAAVKKHPAKHMPSNSDHGGPVKKHYPMQKGTVPANSNKAPVKKHPPKNQAGANGRGIQASKSLPMELRAPTGPKKKVAGCNCSSSVASSASNVVPTKKKLSPQRAAPKRTRSCEFGAAGKIRFIPRKSDDSSSGTKSTEMSTAKTLPSRKSAPELKMPVKKVPVKKIPVKKVPKVR